MIDRLVSAVKTAIKSFIRDVHTSVPGRIESYDPGTQTASVQPLVNQRIYNSQTREVKYEDHPVIPKVPVAFPSASGGGMTFPLEEGDPVVLVFSESPLDEWLAGDGITPVNPFSARKHDYSDAIAIPGARPTGEALDDDKVADNPVIYGPVVQHGSAEAQMALAVAEKTADKLEELRQELDGHFHVIGDEPPEDVYATADDPIVAGRSPAYNVSMGAISTDDVASETVFSDD